MLDMGVAGNSPRAVRRIRPGGHIQCMQDEAATTQTAAERTNEQERLLELLGVKRSGRVLFFTLFPISHLVLARA